MKTIGEVANQELAWSQASPLRSSHELRAGDEVVATITFERSTLATAESEGARWTFKREGFWRQQVTARAEGSEDNIAVFRPHALGGGELRTAEGKVFHLAAAHFWHQEWAWAEGDQVLVRFKSRPGLLRTNGLVEVAREAVGQAELPLLVVLGWYLILLVQRDAALAGQAASSGARVVVMR